MYQSIRSVARTFYAWVRTMKYQYHSTSGVSTYKTSHFKIFCGPHIEVLKYEHYKINTNYLFINKNSNEKIGIVSFQPIGLYLQI